MGVRREESHLAFRVATIGAMRVGFNEFSNLETICRFSGRDPQVRAHEKVSGDSRITGVSTKASIPHRPYSRRCDVKIESASECIDDERLHPRPPQGAGCLASDWLHEADCRWIAQ
jgi:hypothetical protein